MALIVLIGAQATGKMTVGKELEKRIDGKLLFNHQTIDLFANYLGYNHHTFRLSDSTRKDLFEAFVADTIPIYYGSDNDPEPGLINKDAVVFWYKNSSNDKARKLIKELCVDDNAYSDFIKQKKILPAATDYIWSRYEELKQRLEVMNK